MFETSLKPCLETGFENGFETGFETGLGGWNWKNGKRSQEMMMEKDVSQLKQAFFVRFERNSILPKSLKLDFFPLKPNFFPHQDRFFWPLCAMGGSRRWQGNHKVFKKISKVKIEKVWH